MSIAILKPDHLGDLILSVSAIRAVLAKSPSATLFVNQGNIAAARFLFSNADIQIFGFPHLSKAGEAQVAEPNLAAFDVVLILRSDGVITKEWATLRTKRALIISSSNTVHQSILDYGATSQLCGHYDADEMFFGDTKSQIEAKALSQLKTVGFSIGSGFHANRWPNAHWITLGKQFLKDGIDVKIIGGPSERERAKFLAEAIGVVPTKSIIIGGANISEFLNQVAQTDLVIASDGGTAHLCSLVVPILSVFGPSPHQRYAPFGRHNRVITREMLCSPCLQYHSRLVNGCMTMECLALIDPKTVYMIVTRPMVRLDMVGCTLRTKQYTLFTGLSSMNRELYDGSPVHSHWLKEPV